MTKIILFLFLLITTSQIFAQDNVPELPYYTKLKPSDIHEESLLYKGKEIDLFHEDYQIELDENWESSMVVYYQLENEKKLDMLFTRAREKKSNSLREAGFHPWFIIYSHHVSFSESTHMVYFFEYTRSPIEFYRLWKPKWRFIKALKTTRFGKETRSYLKEKFYLEVKSKSAL